MVPPNARVFQGGLRHFCPQGEKNPSNEFSAQNFLASIYVVRIRFNCKNPKFDRTLTGRKNCAGF